ncbi:MAG: helix-turn-helix transcriptional regulator [Firmicutes bacterium]|nr:helix-turn-helix transcriptional regulator [Bacillota bacterium]
MSKNFRETLNKQLENPEFKAEYEALEAEYQIINSLINARKSKKMSQEQLAKITGIDQAKISRIEKGIANPSLKTLKRIASGVDMKIKIEFIEK